MTDLDNLSNEDAVRQASEVTVEEKVVHVSLPGLDATLFQFHRADDASPLKGRWICEVRNEATHRYVVVDMATDEDPSAMLAKIYLASLAPPAASADDLGITSPVLITR